MSSDLLCLSWKEYGGPQRTVRPCCGRSMAPVCSGSKTLCISMTPQRRPVRPAGQSGLQARLACRPDWGPWGPLEAEGRLNGRPGPGEPPGGVRPGGAPQPWADLCQRAKIRVRPWIFGRKKIRDLANLDPRRAPREACPVIFVKRHGVKKSAFLMSYRRLKFSQKKWAKSSPAPNVDLNPGRGGGTWMGT